jgi:hypothetical protein
MLRRRPNRRRYWFEAFTAYTDEPKWGWSYSKREAKRYARKYRGRYLGQIDQRIR